LRFVSPGRFLAEGPAGGRFAVLTAKRGGAGLVILNRDATTSPTS
jgi:hypothetical protein